MTAQIPEGEAAEHARILADWHAAAFPRERLGPRGMTFLRDPD